MKIFSMLINALIGACLGSHACVIAQRFGETNFITGRSRCQACQRQLLLQDEIPLISYLYLKGQCRYCQTFIPPKLFYAELIGAASFCKLSLWDNQFWGLAAFVFSLLVLALQDWDQQAIDVWLLLPPVLLALFDPHFHWNNWNLGHLWLIIPILLVMVWFIYQGKMGSGDLYLTAIIYAYWGSLIGTVILLCSCCLFITFFVCTKKQRPDPVAFLPFLYLGQLVYLLLH